MLVVAPSTTDLFYKNAAAFCFIWLRLVSLLSQNSGLGSAAYSLVGFDVEEPPACAGVVRCRGDRVRDPPVLRGLRWRKLTCPLKRPSSTTLSHVPRTHLWKQKNWTCGFSSTLQAESRHHGGEETTQADTRYPATKLPWIEVGREVAGVHVLF